MHSQSYSKVASFSDNATTLQESQSSEEVFNSVHTCNDDASCQDVSYPPNSPTVKRMMKYMLENKKIPVEIPQTILQKSKHGKAFNTFPKHLVPEEVECRICKEVLSEPMMKHARRRLLHSMSDSGY